jgi:lactate dehydrogenase-like 2-hydroxyacid dehydrogenase
MAGRAALAIDLLVNLEMPQYSRDHLAERYAVHYWPDPADHPRLLQDPLLERIRAVQTNGSYGLKRPFIEAMPRLEIICAVGAGFEGIDVAAAHARGIVVTHGPGSNAATVADQAWALLLATVRRVPWCDRGVREGRWEEVRGVTPAVTGKKLGIFGLGHVGMAVARRAQGFEMTVGYHNRRPRADVPYRYFADLAALAAWCDVLVVAAPGGPQTYHAVGRDVLDRLGPEGFLVNAARGSLVDSAALIDALRSGRIAGAGLDVIEGEPAVPAEFRDLERLVLSPHVGGFSPEAIRAMIHKVRANLDAHFAGKPVPSPVPVQPPGESRGDPGRG